MLKFSEITAITGGEVLQVKQDHTIGKLLIDSRQSVIHSQAVFFAIQGPRHDGHNFLAKMYTSGVRNFVVQNLSGEEANKFPEANIIRVDNSVRALQQIATHHRDQFQLPVLGITGSNAKTVIKEWLYQLMRDKKVIKSPKSYNSQVGVPLSVWQLHASADLAIFEAGISQPGEMEYLEKIIQPSVGIFTNIGPAHDRGFTNLQQKVSEKAKLFHSTNTVIYCLDHTVIHDVLNKELSNDQLLSWSSKGAADIQFTTTLLDQQTKCQWIFQENSGEVVLPFTDPASLENLMHCLAFLLFQGYSNQSIQTAINGLESVPHRLALKKGRNNCYLVDDTYNNDLAGLEVALDFLKQQPHGKEKVLILSDILQAAEDDEALYNKVADLVRSNDIKNFYGIGQGLSDFKHLFESNHHFYLSTEAFLAAQVDFRDQLILVKGARDFGFEAIVHQLQEKHHGTILEIDLDALTFNLNHFRSLVSARTKIMVMVKAFAYGSGSQEVAHLLQYQAVDYLGVAYADEGVALRQDGIHLPIMVMNPAPEDFDQLFEYHLEPEIYSFELLEKFQQYSQKQSDTLKVHLKIDTGMKRLGFTPEQLDDLVHRLKIQPLQIASIFSHLAASDASSEENFSKQQQHLFQQAAHKIEQGLEITTIKHLLNSSGILRFPEYHFDMVRLGIGMYGVAPNTTGLQCISTLKTTISQIKQLKKGETVGYGRKGVAASDRTIATIAIGYADGFDRRNSNGVGKVLVGTRLVPVIGNVCMDMTMIDVTDIEVHEGDPVTIFNDQRTVQQVAEEIGTIPYEILTQVSERVKRVYFAQ